MRFESFIVSLLIVFSSCSTLLPTEDVLSSDDFSQDVDNELKVKFNSLWSNTHEKDCFLFFTDPHLLSSKNRFTESTRSQLVNQFSYVKTIYDNLPISFCLCGGDWLNSGDTQEVARQKLLYADEQMKSLFNHYYKMMGNHDTNYQGIVSSSDKSRGDFQRDFVDNYYFSETKSAYYSFVSNSTEYYILDSGLDWTAALDDYRIEQLNWLANELCGSGIEHKAIGIHMFYNEPDIMPMSVEIASICTAYNSRGEYSLGESVIDFKQARGKVHFIFSGHRHKDFLEYIDGIPIVGTCNFLFENTPTFEVCVVDYNTGYLEMIREGKGKSRSIRLFM